MVLELANFTCEWTNSQMASTSVASLFGLVVIHSLASYVTRHGRKSVASHSKFLSHATFCRVTQITQGGQAQVVGRSLIGRTASQVRPRSVASVPGGPCPGGPWRWAQSARRDYETVYPLHGHNNHFQTWDECPSVIGQLRRFRVAGHAV